MSSLDEELLMDAEEDARIVAHIQQVLPQELKEKFTEDDRKDKVGNFTADDLLFFVDASLSYDLSED